MREVHYRAAGGVVIGDGKVLLLERPSRGELRLPKGHVEEGESAAQTALREVGEESGYSNLVIVADLGTRQVQFVDPYRDRQVVREEHYYLMRLLDEGRIEHQAQEEQFRPIWVPASAAVARLTFDSEREFVRRALRWMNENGMR
jgi:8-oxo-dGTP pyrophosphatase MutT (NUDIX family)